eukprot:TRINITY_DN71582_c0_g1_i1.p1 TRINITY_DN71582_c0_g1~~TRINITY_DN71582_c0_g1_i1.p1  ORF type:complete len:530 (-),score=96.49 TRINITY_DN71582_c0_g1_i1:111-1700(-)
MSWLLSAAVASGAAIVASASNVCVGRLVFGPSKGAFTPAPTPSTRLPLRCARSQAVFSRPRFSPQGGADPVVEDRHVEDGTDSFADVAKDGVEAEADFEELLWFGALTQAEAVAAVTGADDALALCPGSPARCFFASAAGRRPSRRPVEVRIWWQNPVHVVELPRAAWTAYRAAAATVISAPVLWNGQDTSNIFHVLVSFLSRLWLHLHARLPDGLASADTSRTTTGAAAAPAVFYVFDLHPGRPHMFSDDGSPLVPGAWALEFARHAMPAVRILHVSELLAQAPVLFRSVNFNLVNWGSWVLPSEDLYPPRISRRAVGPHPLLVGMPRTVKASLAVRDTDGDGAVLLIRRSAPAGRRLTNGDALAEALRSLGLRVRVADLSLMLFAAQVEAVAHAAVLVGAHGQGLFNLIFLPAGGSVVEVPPCGVPLALVFNVASLFGIHFSEVLDSDCDEAFMERFRAHDCSPCPARLVATSGRVASDVDSAHVGDCDHLDPACDVRSAQTLTLGNVTRAAEIVLGAWRRSAAGGG